MSESEKSGCLMDARPDQDALGARSDGFSVSWNRSPKGSYGPGSPVTA